MTEPLAENEGLTIEQRQRFMAATEGPLRVRRNVLRLAAHVTGHHKHPHGESCEECRERWPCVAVRRAAGPVLDAVADLPSQHPQLGARALRDAALAVPDELGAQPTASAIIRWLNARADAVDPRRNPPGSSEASDD